MTPSLQRLRRNMLRATFIGLAMAVGPGSHAATATESANAIALPSNSIYQLSVALTDQLGRTQPLSAQRGHPLLVSMFYTSCQFVCPMLVEALRDTQAQLTENERSKVSVLLVTIDPQRDTVAVLDDTAHAHQLDPKHWTLARTDTVSTRKLAAVLGVQYRKLPSGEFNHTTAVILLDADGRVVGHTSELGSADPAFVRLLKVQLHSDAP